MRAVMDFSKEPAMVIEKDNHCELRTVKPENIFRFPQGILGFEYIKEYVFIINPKVEPFIFMHALDGSDLNFVCIESFTIRPDYTFTLPPSNIRFLDLKAPADLMVLSIVTVRKTAEEITANLMSPVLINMKNSIAQQIILDEQYPVKFNIWAAIEHSANALRVG